MTHETYMLIVCAIVYVMMASVSIAVIMALTKMSLKLIRHGAEDEQIIKEYGKKRKNKGNLFDTLISALFCVVFACAFLFSAYVSVSGNVYFDDIPTLKVVNSPSMAKKHEKNEYLFKNNLNDQFDTFDVVLTYKIPDEFDLKLYDVVVYEMEDILVIHRIVEIEEPTTQHPNERYFRTQGDNVETADRFPVHYSQMRAIYRGEKIPFVGSFINFMQSPAGWLCMILMLAATIATPIIDKKLEKARLVRYALLCEKQRKTLCGHAQGNAVFAAPVCLYPVYYDSAKVAFSAPNTSNESKGESQ